MSSYGACIREYSVPPIRTHKSTCCDHTGQLCVHSWYSCRRLELPCMLAAAAAAGKFWLLLLLLAAATGCYIAAASSSSRNQKLSSSQQPAAASMGMAAAWLLHGHAAWAWLLHGHAAASKPGCMVHGMWRGRRRARACSNLLNLQLCRSTAVHVLNLLVPCLILLLEKVVPRRCDYYTMYI